jgi:hypothetical protein
MISVADKQKHPIILQGVIKDNYTRSKLKLAYFTWK